VKPGAEPCFLELDGHQNATGALAQGKRAAEQVLS
jgi:hypothetical protein